MLIVPVPFDRPPGTPMLPHPRVRATPFTDFSVKRVGEILVEFWTSCFLICGSTDRQIIYPRLFFPVRSEYVHLHDCLVEGQTNFGGDLLLLSPKIHRVTDLKRKNLKEGEIKGLECALKNKFPCFI